ncbi:crossover junction endodeoxyribonuclease RuvC [Heliophilum fasciatum]|nr:crossover junction endodeoxyribonuclease RuvC [Heliophilum fasciatum]
MIRCEGNRLSAVAFGAVTTEAGTPMPERLVTIANGLDQIIAMYQPERVAIEELFFNRNVTTALTVGQARGVAILSAARCNIPVREYTPGQVKQAVTGYGRADKKQVQEMVRMLLALPAVPKPDDVADALAVAICCAHSLAGEAVWR